jgi:tRNA dimethylallyltransferase
MEIPRLITILGPTAAGKTRLAALLADTLEGEIISADSRQVYRGMTVGTGKDIDDYEVGGKAVPFHLIDVADPVEEFHVFRFKQMFIDAASDILQRNRQVIMCGGTGLYLDAVLRDYFFVEVPENQQLRIELGSKSTEELAAYLTSVKKVHNSTDLVDRHRLIRAIEIHEFHSKTECTGMQIQIADSRVFGVLLPRDQIRERIASRLHRRIEEGMTDEVRSLLNSGVSADRLISFGLEYRYVTQHILGHFTKEEMQEKLCTAIQQFAKRQMSWFRRMERLGIHIEWIDGTLSQESRLSILLEKLGQ